MTHSSQIWLVRHGETEWSRSGQHTGRTDLPLTAHGIEEAHAAAALLNKREFALVLCSPLQRAMRTCEIAGYIDRARIEPLCMEWDYGDFNGLTRAQIKELRGPDWQIWESDIPNGESLAQVADRARQVISLFPGDGDTLVFAHGHFLRILTAVYLGLAPACARHFALQTAALSVLGYDYGSPAMLVWNRR